MRFPTTKAISLGDTDIHKLAEYLDPNSKLLGILEDFIRINYIDS
jgi:hypothetical protein